MENIQNDAVHESEPVHASLSCIDAHHIDELSKEKEEELLYGADDDELSDDSLRLRFSDEELELEDIVISLPQDGQPLKTENIDDKTMLVESGGIQLSNIPESGCNMENNTGIDEEQQKYNAERTSQERNIVEDASSSAERGLSITESKKTKSESVVISQVTNSCDPESLEFSGKGTHETQNAEHEDDISKVNESQTSSSARNEEYFNGEVMVVNNEAETCEMKEEDNFLDVEKQNEQIINDNGKKNDIQSIVPQDLPGTDTTNLVRETDEIVANTVNSDEKANKGELEVEYCLGNDTIISKDVKNVDNAVESATLAPSEKFTVSVIDNKQNIRKEADALSSAGGEINGSKNGSLTAEEHNVNATNGILPDTVQKPVRNNCPSISEAVLDTVITKSDERREDVANKADTAVFPRKRGRPKKIITHVEDVINLEDAQAKEVGRQKRKTAKNAEEIIRKKFLNHDSDLESSDDSEKYVPVNHKISQDVRPSSPPSLKRSFPDSDNSIVNGGFKKIKVGFEESHSHESPINESKVQDIKKLSFVEKFFQRDLKEKLPKLKQEELEELLIQKIVETITMRGEIGRLREQARLSEKNQEAMRTRYQQLAKQIKDFEMVITRYAADRRANNEKFTTPIKINRSVGLQVNLVTEHGMQNLRQLQQNSSSSNNDSPVSSETNNNAVSSRRSIKTRTPRRAETPTVPVQTTVPTQTPVPSPQLFTTVTSPTLGVTKSVDSPHNTTLPKPINNKLQILPNQQQPQPQPQIQQTIVLNGKVSTQTARPEVAQNAKKSGTNDLIDLTDEEEKNKAAPNASSIPTPIPDQQTNTPPVQSQQCFQRVIQTIPASMALTGQTGSIRVVQPASQPTPTALVNNMHSPRLAYVMQTGVGSGRQLLITSNANQIRPVTSCNRGFSYIQDKQLTYKAEVSTIANGTVRVIASPASQTVQVNQHPAPLPDAPAYAIDPTLKLPPPAPSLKISKVANGIVLSWNMTLSDKYADIVSYQLYAYQEVSGVPPSTNLWKKVGDVRALPLPMACTLTQFSKGNNYYFAVRAVDTHSRKGQYSMPGNISL